jgi:hypothetical protein
MKRITANDLSNWAKTRDSQEHLPLLIRKLIQVSSIQVTKLRIPTGDNIVLSGFDGIVETIQGTTFIPAGLSAWEMGVTSKVKGKADTDYTGRVNDKTIEHEKYTFVFVTPHIWEGKQAWIDEKKREGIWKDIFVIDGIDLELWIEQHVVIGLWLAKLLHLPLGNGQPMEYFWEEWRSNQQYSISPELVICGRSKEADQLKQFLINPPACLLIRASTSQEAVAFVAATIATLAEDEKELIYAKMVLVNNEQDFRNVSLQQSPLIIVIDSPIGSAYNAALTAGHRVIIALGNDANPAKSDIELPRIKRLDFEEELKKMGFSNDVAERLTSDSGQSLSVLRRLLHFDRDYQPEWIRGGNYRDILPALLAGMWDESKDEDKGMIEVLAGESYSQYIARFSRWQMQADPVIFQVRKIWRFTSTLDAWSMLAPYITQADLENLRTVVMTVLGEINPGLTLEGNQRYLAPVLGKSPKFSRSICEGLCQTLILIAVFGKDFRMNGTNNPQGYVDRILYSLLYNVDSERWRSLYRNLPLLAEASPDIFLQSVEHSLQIEDQPIAKMFIEEGDMFYSSHYYTGLLWALENLLYSPDYISRTTLLLARLSTFESGIKTYNKPITTLIHAFIPWYRQTHTDLSTKKQVLSLLVQKYPDVAWKLFRKLLPQDHVTVSPIHRCRWRFDTQFISREVSYGEVGEYYTFLFEHLFELAKNNEDRIAKLMSYYPDGGEGLQEKLRGFLKDSFQKKWQGGKIWETIRDLMARHREYADTDWALPAEELDKLQEFYDMYLPNSNHEINKYLFESEWPEFTEGTGGKTLSHEEKSELLNQKRIEILKELYASEGLNGLKRFGASMEKTDALAYTSAIIGFKSEEETEVLQMLNSETGNKWRFFSTTYIKKRSFDLGMPWIKNAWQKVLTLHSDSRIQAEFFLAVVVSEELWELLEMAPEETQNEYWTRLHPIYLKDDPVLIEFEIRKLQSVNRHLIIADSAWYIAEKIGSSLIAEILENAATKQTGESVKLSAHHVHKLLEVLYERGDLPEKNLHKLEWIYLSSFREIHRKKPKYLLRELTNNPDFFIELICLMYRPDSDDKEEVAEEEWEMYYQRANNARQLLDCWTTIPGMGEDSLIDSAALKSWVKYAREKAVEQKRVYGVDSQIGSLLASYPRKDEQWPPDCICEILDDVNSEAMLSSFRTEIVNSRGVTVRSPFAGGEQERVLAGKFDRMAQRILHRYPITASVLSGLAERYKYDAYDEDERARLDELR